MYPNNIYHNCKGSKAMNKQVQQLYEQSEQKPRSVASGLLSISAFISSSFLAILCLAGCATASNAQAQINYAAELGDVQKVRALIAADPAVVDAKEKDGVTPLWIAAQQGHLEVMKVLLEKGAVVDAKTNDGFTPLLIAAEYGHLEVVRMLLEKGANPNSEALGFTPLRIAEKKGHTDIVILLRKAGAK